jgi:hypothetical protein
MKEAHAESDECRHEPKRAHTLNAVALEETGVATDGFARGSRVKFTPLRSRMCLWKNGRVAQNVG